METIGVSEHNAIKETAYLQSTEANRKAISKSIKQSKEGKTTPIKTADLWK